jgi:hypothetical protein
VSITVPSGDDPSVIWYIERARAINGMSLLTWYALMTLALQRPRSLKMAMDFR